MKIIILICWNFKASQALILSDYLCKILQFKRKALLRFKVTL